MAGRLTVWLVVVVLLPLYVGCECGSKTPTGGEPAELPEGFEQVMRDHAALSVAARNALIRGDLAVAQQAMRKLAFMMEHVPPPQQGKEFARITQELAEQVRGTEDLEEACMAFAQLSYACGECHHALDRGPPMKLDPAPEGEDIQTHMRRHYWAIERMWEALLAHSTVTFQSAAEVLAEAPLHGGHEPDHESQEGVTRLAYEVHDLAFAAAVEGKAGEDEYVPKPGEATGDEPSPRGQAEMFGRILSTCSRCHGMLDVNPPLTDVERRSADP